MVRKLAAALVAVGQERVAAGVIVGYLASPGGKWQGSIAPAHGLCLERVIFDEAQTGS
jgi:tRNA U38,U39,U40 pseudouridine synthase TruA